MPADAVRVRIELRDRKALELRTVRSHELGKAFYATVTPYRATVTRVTVYDDAGKVVFDDRKPFNTPWPGEPGHS
jgi:hypothetical protein